MKTKYSERPLAHLTKGLFILMTMIIGFPAEAKPVRLKWKPVERAVQYQIELSDDGEFSKVIRSFRAKENKLNVDLPSGVYFLRVQTINKWGIRGDWGHPFRLVVTGVKGELPKGANINPDSVSVLSIIDAEVLESYDGDLFQHLNRHHRLYIGLGHAISEDLGSGVGSKINIRLAMDVRTAPQGDFSMFYDHNFLSSQAGSSPITWLGAGWKFHGASRFHGGSPFVGLFVGYGGSNRNLEAGPIAQVGIGWQGFRTEDYSFEFFIGRLVFASSNIGSGRKPTVDQIRLGILF
ncbi:MAG: hypothetical protein IT289_03475 [Oligoflexia bacterium]|nr:hypothetical protein [Oligoflexia bacterium]